MAKGYNALADVLRVTADGRDLNELYAELQAATAVQNEQRQRFLDLLTYPVTSPVTSVLQTLGAGDVTFEEATEFGRPQAHRVTSSTLDMGATFKWYDSRTGWTWRYLADASSVEISAAANAVLDADKDLVFNAVMGTIFNPVNRTVIDKRTGSSYTVFAFANGDGWAPPAYAGNTFSGAHTHYRTTGGATINSGDLDEIIDDLKSHGYSSENGSQMVVFVHPNEGNTINTFRVANGARADFIPAAGARFYSPNQLVGDQPAGTFAGFPVKGAYDELLIIESTRIPAGYVVALASGGSLVPSNPIMLRQHERFPGLVLIPGNSQAYPLQDSYFSRGFGTGIRHRLAGLVMQVSGAANYTAPSLYSV